MRRAALNPFATSVGLLIAALAGCTSSAGARSPDEAHWPAYAGPAIAAFDDRIEPAAVGLADASLAPRVDALMRQRVGGAELVARGRISTVTVDSVEGERTYHVSFVPTGEPLVARTPLPRVELSIRSHDPAFGVVKALDSSLIGHTFIGFFRRFAGTEEPDVHWHLAPDSAEVASAVRDAAALGELHR